MTVWLPATTAEPAPAADAAAEVPPGGGERVLVVEDQPGVREVSRRILTEHGYDVLSVEDPEEAVRIALDGTPPDVLVTDVLMPGLSGAQLVERVRARLPDMPVVFVSGFAEEAQTATSGDAPTLFVEKPFRAGELLTAVARALRARR